MIESKDEAREVFKEDDLKQASWAYVAADRNGYRRALREIINLIDVDQHK